MTQQNQTFDARDAAKAFLSDGESGYAAYAERCQKAPPLDSTMYAELGYILTNLNHPFSDQKAGARCLEIPALNGDVEAQRALGFIYGGEYLLEERKSLLFFAMAAAKKDIPAMHEIGCFFLSGFGVSKNPAEAARWFQTIAGSDVEADSVESWYKGKSCYELGVLFKEGNGVKMDWEEALRLFDLAAGEGHANAEWERDKIVEWNARYGAA